MSDMQATAAWWYSVTAERDPHRQPAHILSCRQSYLCGLDGRAYTVRPAPFDSGRKHGPSESSVDCGCGWGTLCDTGPYGALCDASPYHGRQGAVSS